MPSVVVLGAAGYIGFSVVRAFASEGYDVYAVVRKPEYREQLLKAGAMPIIASATDTPKWRDAASVSQTIVMCSGSARTPAEEHRAMFDAIVGVAMETTRENEMGRKTLIYTCGLALFGNSDTGLAQRTVDETSRLGEGLWPGMLSRRQIEKELLSHSEINGIVIRPGYVYGGSGGPLAMYFREALTKGTVTGYGDPEAPISAVHVDDLAEAYVLAAMRGDVVRGQAFNMSNLGAERRRSCLAAVARAVGLGESAVSFTKAPDNMVMLTRAMYAPAHKAARLLGWRQRRPGFVDGIDRWLREFKVWNPTVGSAKL